LPTPHPAATVLDPVELISLSPLQFPDGMPVLTPYERNPAPIKGFAYFLMLSTLWFGFIRSINTGSKLSLIVSFSLFYGAIHFFAVPGLLAFAYVNCLLGLHYALNALFFVRDKGPLYNVATLMLGVPTGFVAWLEAMGCENIMRPLGGHVLYDSTLSVGMCVFFVYALTLPVEPELEKPKKV
jgi:hypothetical protein